MLDRRRAAWADWPYRHWRRAKFLGRFRLFFRFSSAHKTIVYAWVKDETTLRKAGARTDPYAVFMRRLREGNPPDRWDELLGRAETGYLARVRLRS